jgi:hypothetical protein
MEGCHSSGVLSSTQKGETVSRVMHFFASGAFVHPMLIFLRKRRQQAFQLNLPHGTWAEDYETRWMAKPLFCTWFKKFIRLSAQDGYRSHTKSLQLMNNASKNWVIVLISHHTVHTGSP